MITATLLRKICCPLLVVLLFIGFHNIVTDNPSNHTSTVTRSPEVSIDHNPASIHNYVSTFQTSTTNSYLAENAQIYIGTTGGTIYASTLINDYNFHQISSQYVLDEQTTGKSITIGSEGANTYQETQVYDGMLDETLPTLNFTETSVSAETLVYGSSTGISGAQTLDGSSETLSEEDLGPIRTDDWGPTNNVDEPISYLWFEDGGFARVDKGEVLHTNSCDTTGISGTKITVTLFVNYTVDPGYSGNNYIEYKKGNDASYTSTSIIPLDGEIGVVKNETLYSGAGSITLAELEKLNLRFVNNDPTTPNYVDFERIWIVVTPRDFRLNIEQEFSGVPISATFYEICIYGNRSADEIIKVEVLNSTTDWEELGQLEPSLTWNNFTIDLTRHVIAGNVNIRYVDSFADSNQSDVKVDIALVKASGYSLDLYYSFQWTGDEVQVTNISVWDVSSGNQAVNAYIWDFANSKWDTLNFNLGTSIANHSQSVSSSLENYLSGTGNDNHEIRIRYLEVNSDNSASLSVDYLCVNLHFSTGNPQQIDMVYDIEDFPFDRSTATQVTVSDSSFVSSGIAQVQIFNYTTNQWISCFSITEIVETFHNYTFSSSPSDLMSLDSGNIQIRYSFSDATAANLSVDYLGVDITYVLGGGEIITVTTPTVFYDSGTQTLDIAGINATCTNSAHGDLDDQEAIISTYTVYTSEGIPTNITGNLMWTGIDWQALDVDISSLSDGTYYVRCYFEDSDATGTSSASNTFTIDRGGNGTGNGDGGGGGGSDSGDGTSDGDGGGTGKSSCILDFLSNFYSTKPDNTFTLLGTIDTNANGQLITVTFEGETHKVYTSNNGEFEVTLTAPSSYGSYKATAKFAGDANWESASTICKILVIEEETQMNLQVEGSMNKGEQITITATVTKENGDPVSGEQITIYIYERRTSSTTSSFSIKSDVNAFAADVRNWNLIETLEVTTAADGTAATEWTVSTDNDVQIVAEYSGKVEGEGGENIGSSTASYVEGEAQPQLFVISSEMWYLFGGVIAIIVVVGLVVVLKTGMLSRPDPMREGLALINTQGRVRIQSLAETLSLPEAIVREKLETARRNGRLNGTYARDGIEFVTLDFLQEELLNIIEKSSPMQPLRVEEMAKQLSVPREALIESFHNLSKEYKVYGVFNETSDEFIHFSPEKKDGIIQDILDTGLVKLSSFAEAFSITSELMKRLIDLARAEGLLSGAYTQDNKYFITTEMETLKKELLNVLNSSETIKLDELARRVGCPVKELETVLITLMGLKELKSAIERITDREIRCIFCGGRITDDVQYCPWCGAQKPQCTVCLLPIIQGDDLIECPHCGSFAHRTHLIEWIKVKGCCPYCRERLTEFDISS